MLKSKLWQSNKYIPFFGYRFFYKPWFIYKIAKPLNLPAYHAHIAKKKVKRKEARKKFGRTLRNPQYKKELLFTFQKHCGICGEKFKEDDRINIDHIIPLSKGEKKDRNKLENLQLAHYDCNQRKGNKIEL